MSLKPLKCSVIIPVHNGAATIKRAIQSAARCEGVDDVLVYDDASTDRTFDIVDDLFAHTPHLEYFSVSDFRQGVVFARNYLVEQADYGLIIPLDADDELITIKPFLDAYKDGTWLYGGWVELDENPALEGKKYNAPAPGMLKVRPLCYATMCFHKKDFEKIGGYHPDFNLGAEDYALQVALTSAGITPVRVNETIHYRYTDANNRTPDAVNHWQLLHERALNKYPLDPAKAPRMITSEAITRLKARKPKYRGVYESGGKHHARIQRNKHKEYLGAFDTPEDAHKAYLIAAQEYCAEMLDPAILQPASK